MMRDDNAIRQDIIDQLNWDARVNAAKIAVTVVDGHAQLMGTTPTYSERMAAYEDAWTVPAVVAVQNLIVVTPPDDFDLPSDDVIQENIERTLRLHPLIDALSVEPVVEAGHVELRGSVDAYWKMKRLESMIADIGGVIDIENNLSVIPTTPVTDGNIAELVNTALARNALVDESRITVSVENGLVKLSGTVASWAAYREAYQTALHTDGVIGIIDELSVGDPS